MISYEEIVKRINEKEALDKFKNWIIKAILSDDKTLGKKYYDRFFHLKNKFVEPYNDYNYWKEERTVEELIKYIDSFLPEEERFPSNAGLEDQIKKPLKIVDYIPPKLIIPTRGGKAGPALLRRQFRQILTFIKFTQKRRYKDCCTILSIPTTSAENELIWGSRANISNAIMLMEEIKLIEIEDPTYRFHAFKEDENRCRTFRYYVEVEKEFLEYCKKNNIDAYSPDEEDSDEITAKEIRKFEEIEDLPNPKMVRFSSSLKLKKPSGLSKTQFERYLRKCLYDNYPYFIEALKAVKKINKEFYADYPEFLIRFKPTFTWGKKTKKGDTSNAVVAIGIRATNAFCNKEKEERKGIIKSYGFDLEKDITSSVPRLTLSMNKGEWIGEKEDLYKLISQELDPNVPCEKGNLRREAIKNLHMSVYFDEGSKIGMGKNVWWRMTKNGARKNDVDEEIEKLKKAMIKVEGGMTFGSEIFYIESWIYLMVLYNILTEEKQLVWLVYDCFYGKGYASKRLFDSGISVLIRNYFDMFYKEWKRIESGEKRKVNLKAMLYLEDIMKNMN